MQRLSFPIDENNLLPANAWLRDHVEQLTATGKKNIRIRYPGRFADELEIAVARGTGRYLGIPATTHDETPYELII